MADVKRNDNIQFTYKRKPVTGTILHTSKAKTRIWLHEDRSDHQITYLEAKGAVFTHTKIGLEDLPEFIRDKVVNYASIEKGDLVSFFEDGVEHRGLVGSVTATGVNVNMVGTKCSVPWSFELTKVESTVVEQPMPLDDWSATRSESSIPHHDGGKCQKITIFHKAKKVIEVIEDAWGGESEVKTFGLIDGESPDSLLERHAVESFKIVEMPEDKTFYTDSAHCIGEWLAIRKLVGLKERFGS